jgi:hypothetical protein
MVDLGRTSFFISPDTAKAFSIPVIKRTEAVKTAEVSRRNIATKRLFMVPVGVSFVNHHAYDEIDSAFEVI